MEPNEKTIHNLEAFESEEARGRTDVPSCELSCFSRNGKAGLLTLEEEKRLFLQIKNGSKDEKEIARATIASHNMGLVIAIAQEFDDGRLHAKDGNFNDDLILAGCFGLLNAIETFDLRRNVKFSTYAHECIQNSIYAFLRQDNKERNMSAAPYGVFKKVEDARKFLSSLGQGSVWAKDISDYLGDMSEDEVQRVLDTPRRLFSLDDPVFGENSGDSLLSYVDSGEELPQDVLKEKERKALLEKGFYRCLSEKERFVLDRVYGSHGETKMTLKAIGLELGLSGERVRQIKMEAEHKITRYCVAELSKRN